MKSLPTILRDFKTLVLKERELIAITLTLVLFFLCSLYFALNIKLGVFPDEGFHSTMSTMYKDSYTQLEDSEETYRWGQISRQPFLYHWIMGRVLQFNPLDTNTIDTLRVVNSVISLFAAFIYYRIASEVTKSSIVRVLSVFVVTNTLMYIFMSGAINYDNLLLLFCALSVYSFVRFIKYTKISDIIVLSIWISLGVLTKISFLPFSLFVLFALIISLSLNLYKINFRELTYLHNIVLLIVALPIIVISTNYIGTNIVEYGSPVPDCNKVITEENCLRAADYARNAQLSLKLEQSPVQLMSPISYSGHWLDAMINGVYGIVAHVPFIRYTITNIPYLVLNAVAVFAFLKRFKMSLKPMNILGIIALSYILTLFFFVNYSNYRDLGEVGVALQGRYIFPVYFLFTLLIFDALFKTITVQFIKIAVVIFLVVLYLYGGFGFFFRYANLTLVNRCSYIINLKNC